jgi:hypothetical protein
MFLSRRAALVGLSSMLLSACVGPGSSFRTEYTPVPPVMAANWRLAEVQVTVPRTLKVSEAKTYLPTADIVWREDPMGDRYDQVGKIMETAILRGAQGLSGARPVIIAVTVTRFHALTFEAEQRFESAGVHNIKFTAQVVDAATGEVLVPPTPIRAELPALSGKAMREARRKGQSQKSMITAHVAKTVAGWLGLGPDVRGSFSRQGN